MAPSRRQEIVAAYEEWVRTSEDSGESVDDLTKRLGISRQGLYGHLRREGVVLKSRRGEQPPVGPLPERELLRQVVGDLMSDELVEELARTSFQHLLETILEQKLELEDLRAEVAELKAQLSESTASVE